MVKSHWKSSHQISKFCRSTSKNMLWSSMWMFGDPIQSCDFAHLRVQDMGWIAMYPLHWLHCLHWLIDALGKAPPDFYASPALHSFPLHGVHHLALPLHEVHSYFIACTGLNWHASSASGAFAWIVMHWMRCLHWIIDALGKAPLRLLCIPCITFILIALGMNQLALPLHECVPTALFAVGWIDMHPLHCLHLLELYCIECSCIGLLMHWAKDVPVFYASPALHSFPLHGVHHLALPLHEVHSYFIACTGLNWHASSASGAFAWIVLHLMHFFIGLSMHWAKHPSDFNASPASHSFPLHWGCISLHYLCMKCMKWSVYKWLITFNAAKTVYL